MKFSGRPILVVLVMLIYAAPAFAIDLDTLRLDVNNFSIDMNKSLPFNSTIGLNWSDAYIGGFHHFGIGLSAGLTTMKNKSINKMMTSFGMPKVKDLPFVGKDRFPLPAYTVDARMGLPVIPIDFGIKVGYIGQNWLEPLIGIGIKDLIVGADVRYVIVNSKVLPMRLSVGLGFNYLNGEISYSPSSLNFTDNTYGLDLKADKVGILWNTKNIEFKVQTSFPYKIITPYAGAGISYAWSEAGYRVSGLSYRISGVTISDDDIKKLEALGVKVPSKDNFEKINKYNGFNSRLFAGFSINLAFVRLDLTGMYEIMNQNFGATFGLRFQM
jgi:hypothetical protein